MSAEEAPKSYEERYFELFTEVSGEIERGLPLPKGVYRNLEGFVIYRFPDANEGSRYTVFPVIAESDGATLNYYEVIGLGTERLEQYKRTPRSPSLPQRFTNWLNAPDPTDELIDMLALFPQLKRRPLQFECLCPKTSGTTSVKLLAQRFEEYCGYATDWLQRLNRSHGIRFIQSEEWLFETIQRGLYPQHAVDTSDSSDEQDGEKRAYSMPDQRVFE